jgi:GT2 family glycosyltransferase
MTVSVMITTRNRVEDLKRTTRALTQLDPVPQEILITADGCTDGTIEFVKSELPTATLIVNEQRQGSVASRDLMMREAHGDLVLALDDDSYPEQVDCIARFVPIFEQRAQLAVLHFPQRTDEYPETLTQPNFGPEHLTRSFANSGAVLRRSTYLQLPGFESRFFHMYEEPDYALQCVAAGYEVLFSPIVIIRHHYSGKVRSELQNHHRHARNELWSVLLRCPFPYVVPVAIYRAAAQFGYGWHRGGRWLLREPLWWWSALKGFPWLFRKRQPVHWSAYKKWLSLR